MFNLKPKKSFTRRELFAQKEFTDREEPKETFHRNLTELASNLLTDNEFYKVLVYYGIGGIGKTSLKNELKKSIMADTVTENAALELDFRNLHSRECASGLLELYQSIKQNVKYSKVAFPHFELAYAMYFKKKNPDIAYNGKEDGFMKFADLGLKIFGITSLFDFGLTSFLTKEGIGKLYSKIKELSLDINMKVNLMNFSEKPLSDMEDDLILFFAEDLKAYLKNKYDLKVVIFIDTFEALFEVDKHELKRWAKCEWVKELILHLPNVLFVITGRDKISWGEKWETVLDQHLISELAPNYALQFLESCGIEENEIRKRINDYSLGHPYYLDLSVDTYFSIKNENKEPQLKDFGTTKTEILERFVTSLSDDELELLKVMVIPTYYNREIFEYLIKQFNIAYSITKFDDFNQYSFIDYNETLKRFTLHQLMRTGMEDYIKAHTDSRVSPTFIQLVNTKLLTYFEEKLNEDINGNIYECIYHRLRNGQPAKFFDWLNEDKIEFMEILQINGETVLLSNIFQQILTHYKMEEFSIELFNIYEDIVHLAGDYVGAVTMAETYLNQYTKEQMLSRSDLIKLKYRIIHHKMFYVKADELINELLMLRSEISQDKFFEEYCEITYMLGGGVGFLTGCLEQCKEYLDALVDMIQSSSNSSRALDNIMTRASRKRIDYYRYTGQTALASQYLTEVLDIQNLNRYQIYLCCSYGDLQRELQNYEESIKYFKIVLSETKKLGIKGWQGHANLSLANVHLEKNELAIAKEYLGQALTIYEGIDQKWGIVNSNIIHARISIEENEQDYLTFLENGRTIAEAYNYRTEIKLIELLERNNTSIKQTLLYV